MTDDPMEIIEALRTQLGAENDAELARKLGIDKSTISSWKRRGSVPDRFKAILEGASPLFFETAPKSWGQHERFAFQVALFRFARARAEVALEGDAKKCLEEFTVSGAFWALMLDAQKQLAARQGDGVHSPETAQALVIYDLLAEGDDALIRDRKLLAPFTGKGERKDIRGAWRSTRPQNDAGV